MKQTLNNALTALDAGKPELARAYILVTLDLLTAPHKIKPDRQLEAELVACADKLHATLAGKPLGMSLLDMHRNDIAALRKLERQYKHPNPVVAARAVAILERHDFAIIRNQSGKGERLISTRF